MRRIARMWLSLVVAGGVASTAQGQTPSQQPRRPSAASQPAPARGPANAKVPDPAEEARKRREMDQLLVLWEKQSARLTSLDATFKRVDKSPGWDTIEEFRGHAYLQNPNLACLHFEKAEPVAAAKPGQKPATPGFVNYERIVCTGTDVLQYNYATKEIFRFPLKREDRKRALEEGPLPFLFNMKAEEAKSRYTMTLIDQNDEAYLIAVRPLLIEDKEVFSSSFIQLNKKTFLPDKLMIVSPNGKDTQDYTFSTVLPNHEISPKFFQAALSIKGWKLIDNPAPSQPTQGARAGQPGQPRQEMAAPGGRGPVGQKPMGQPRFKQ